MAKKNKIWFSVIIVIIIIGYIWLSETMSWSSYMEAVEQNTIPVVSNENNKSNEVGKLSITSLIPPSDTFDNMTEALTEVVSIDIAVNYINRRAYTYSSYQTFLLTEESGDIHLIPNEWILPLAVQGYLMPLDRVLTSEYLEEQNAALVESMKWNSNLWAAPYQVDPYIVVPHQSLLAYFEQAELPNDLETTLEQTEDAVNTPTEEPAEEPVDRQSKADQSINAVKEVLHLLLGTNPLARPLINSEPNDAEHIFQFISYISEDGIHNGQALTDLQQALLTHLMEPGTIIEQELEELLNLDQEQEVLPLFLVLSWSELNAYADTIEQHYDLSRIQVPIYWSNGYSFVVKHHTKQQQLAGQWLEALNHKMKEPNITYVGMPIRRDRLNQLPTSWQQSLALQYNENVQARSLMTISPAWPSFLEMLNSKWQEELELSEKIAYWLDEAEQK